MSWFKSIFWSIPVLFCSVHPLCFPVLFAAHPCFVYQSCVFKPVLPLLFSCFYPVFIVCHLFPNCVFSLCVTCVAARVPDVSLVCSALFNFCAVLFCFLCDCIPILIVDLSYILLKLAVSFCLPTSLFFFI